MTNFTLNHPLFTIHLRAFKKGLSGAKWSYLQIPPLLNQLGMRKSIMAAFCVFLALCDPYRKVFNFPQRIETEKDLGPKATYKNLSKICFFKWR